MGNTSQCSNIIQERNWLPTRMALRVILAVFFLILVILTGRPIQAQTYNVIHNFTGGADGAMPFAGVAIDTSGNLYGTTEQGGYFGQQCTNGGCGTVYQMSNHHGHWIETIVHSFKGVPDDAHNPKSGAVFGPDDQLYGIANGFGVEALYVLQPPTNPCSSVSCNWTESLAQIGYDCGGSGPGYGDVALDAQGNAYSTETFGGYYDVGNIYQVYNSNGVWSCQDFYDFNWETVGGNPQSGVTIDSVGTIYGTTGGGGPNHLGTVYSCCGWVLYSFEGGSDGADPDTGLTIDRFGNLYGTTPYTVFKLTRSEGWAFSLLYTLTDGALPPGAALTIDASGNLYGVTLAGGAYGKGSIFKLTPGQGSRWTYTSLHDFTGADGSQPYGKVTLDANGNMYGTASKGGVYGFGVIWEIKP